jgi:DNA-binding NtrC family response regulator
MAKIAIVDDEAEWRAIYGECLSDAGYTVVTFENGNDALSHIGKHGCDLVVLDVRMSPGGQAVLRALRGIRPDIPVVVASSYASACKTDRDFRDAAAFLDKSPRVSDLLHIVQAILARK